MLFFCILFVALLTLYQVAHYCRNRQYHTIEIRAAFVHGIFNGGCIARIRNMPDLSILCQKLASIMCYFQNIEEYFKPVDEIT